MSNHILTPFHSGFIPGDSSVYQLLSLYDYICRYLDNGVTTQAIFFIYISKAFDKVWHRGLVSKLETIAVRGGLLNWFKNYSAGRRQAVVIKWCRSDYTDVSARAPQGSVLGPLLFLIYINDIVIDIELVIQIFADDTSLYLCLHNDDACAEILNSHLEKISVWATTWKITFNNIKAELRKISWKREPQPLPLNFENVVFKDRENQKILV